MSITVTLVADEWDGQPVQITRTAAGDVVVRGLPAGTTPLSRAIAVLDDPAVAEIKERWRRHDPDSGCFRLTDLLRERGFAIRPPEPRKVGAPRQPYLRPVAKSARGTQVTAFINTESLIILRASLREVASTLPGAMIKAGESVSFDVADVENCLAVMDRLMNS